MVSVILLSHNLGEVTKACVESIHRNVRIPYEIIVVDNGSERCTVELLEEVKGIRLLKNTENLGFPAGCNQGMSEAKGEILWFLNNDTIVTRGSLERMVELLLSDERIGIVGPVTNRISGKQKIAVDYDFTPGVPTTDYAGIDAFAEKNAAENAGKVWKMMRLVGFSMLMRKADMEKMGGFDERMGIGTFEDDSISVKFAANGYQLLVARDAFIHHIGSASFLAAGGYPPGGVQNQQTASKTAGLTIPDEVVLNDEMLKFIPEGTKRVLHAECGGGAYGLYAEEKGIYAEALESNPVKAELARNYYAALTEYTPGVEFTFAGRDFDLIMVEKQYDSEQAKTLVRSVTGAIRIGGRLILQVPGITQIDRGVYEACQEVWYENGYWIRRGKFDCPEFLRSMADLGWELVLLEQKEAKKGFFKRNAFDRQQEGSREGKLEFFHEALFVFEKSR